MESFVFPDEIKTKFMKKYELMTIFPILTEIPQKSCKRAFFIYTGKTVKRPLHFGLPLEGCINKKTQHVDLLTYAY